MIIINVTWFSIFDIIMLFTYSSLALCNSVNCPFNYMDNTVLIDSKVLKNLMLSLWVLLWFRLPCATNVLAELSSYSIQCESILYCSDLNLSSLLSSVPPPLHCVWVVFWVRIRVAVYVPLRRRVWRTLHGLLISRISCQNWWWSLWKKGEGMLFDAYWLHLIECISGHDSCMVIWLQSMLDTIVETWWMEVPKGLKIIKCMLYFDEMLH